MIPFTKMHGCGNDYICIYNQHIEDPGKLAITLTDRHKSIGGDGIVLIQPSDQYHASMRMFNADGTEALMCGNSIRCVGKYLLDHHLTTDTVLQIETASGVKELTLLTQGNLVRVNMGAAILAPAQVPTTLTGDRVVAREVNIAGSTYQITALSMGNPHAIIFTDDLDHFPLQRVGEQIEKSGLFPQGVNLGVVEMVARDHLRMGVFERGTGITKASGTAACAGAVAAVLMGYSDKDTDVSIKQDGGMLVCKYTDTAVYLTGESITSYEGVVAIS